MTESLNWEALNLASDKITAEDILGAESMGKVPVGRYLCTCVSSIPKQKDFTEYSCYAAGLKWKIEEALEINGKEVDPDEGAAYEGRFIFDDIALYAPEEKDGMRNRRIFIAKRCGLILDTSEEITPRMWAEDIIGKRAILTYEDQRYTKDGIEKTTRKVAFAGYDYADGALAGVAEEDNFDDI